MKRETWKMWTWCALVLSIATVGANVFLAFYPNQKDTTNILTPDKIDKLCAEKGWFLIPDAQHNLEKTKYQVFYLSKENKGREEYGVLIKNCNKLDKWKGIILVEDYSKFPKHSYYLIQEHCVHNYCNIGYIHVFGDDTMIQEFKEYINHP